MLEKEQNTMSFTKLRFEFSSYLHLQCLQQFETNLKEC